jgi:glycosyltransferase involved in cell wall biosynthesis
VGCLIVDSVDVSSMEAALFMMKPAEKKAVKKLVILLNDASVFLSHRLPIAQAAQAAGYDVHIATPISPAVAQIQALGLTHHDIVMSRSGLAPWREWSTLWAIIRLYRRLQPDVVHHVTMKPVLYGGIAARLCQVPGMVAAITGLGSVFISRERKMRRLQQVMRRIFRFSLNHPSSKIIFQNPDDPSLLRSWGVIRDHQIVLIQGSGVDLEAYEVQPEPQGRFTVVMAARLLKDKGVYEYVEAIKILKQRGYDLRAILAGSRDEGNPSCVADHDLVSWAEAGVVELPGFSTDISDLFGNSHVVVLPSYREGLPKVLIEAAACGRAVVTTDVPGCRDAIVAGATGLLIPPHQPIALADAIERLLLDGELRRTMGQAARRFAEEHFSIHDVVKKHLEVYQTI